MNKKEFKKKLKELITETSDDTKTYEEKYNNLLEKSKNEKDENEFKDKYEKLKDKVESSINLGADENDENDEDDIDKLYDSLMTDKKEDK